MALLPDLRQMARELERRPWNKLATVCCTRVLPLANSVENDQRGWASDDVTTGFPQRGEAVLEGESPGHKHVQLRFSQWVMDGSNGTIRIQ